jgi:pyrroline-5-carboxylate reductase
MRITFIGGGNMAQAIISGLLRKDRNEFAPENLRVVEINPVTRAKLKQDFGIECFEKAFEAIRPDDVIIFAVKPQHLQNAAKELRAKGYTAGPTPGQSNLIISIAAGVRLSDLAKWLGARGKLIRAMPNTPALIGQGITAIYPWQVEDDDMKRAELILSAVGQTVRINSEDEMNAITAISGSGPAYVFLFMEAIEQAAIELNLPKDAARKLVLQTFVGAARLAAESPESVEVLRERVTSKGGTTERALASMKADRVKEAIVRAVRAAAERSRELGDELGKTG